MIKANIWRINYLQPLFICLDDFFMKITQTLESKDKSYEEM